MPNTFYLLPKFTTNHRQALRKKRTFKDSNEVALDPTNTIKLKAVEMLSKAYRNGYIAAIPFAISGIFVILSILDQTYLNSKFTNSPFANTLGITTILNDTERWANILWYLLAPAVIYMVAEQVRIEMTIRAMRKEAAESNKPIEEKHKDSEEKKQNLQSEAANYNLEELSEAIKKAIGNGEQLADLFSLSIILGAAKKDIVKQCLQDGEFIKQATTRNDAALVITLINGCKDALNLPEETKILLINMVKATLENDDKRYKCESSNGLIYDPVKVELLTDPDTPQYHYFNLPELQSICHLTQSNDLKIDENISPCDKAHIEQIEFLNKVKEKPIQLFRQLVAMGETRLAEEFLENRGELLEILEDQKAEIKKMFSQDSSKNGVTQAKATALSQSNVQAAWVD